MSVVATAIGVRNRLPATNSHSFQNVLAAALKERGWTQVQAARHLGISQALVSAYLRGEREPLLSTATQIAQALGVSLEEFTGTANGIPAVWVGQLKRRWRTNAEPREELLAAAQILFGEDSAIIARWLEEQV